MMHHLRNQLSGMSTKLQKYFWVWAGVQKFKEHLKLISSRELVILQMIGGTISFWPIPMCTSMPSEHAPSQIRLQKEIFIKKKKLSRMWIQPALSTIKPTSSKWNPTNFQLVENGLPIRWIWSLAQTDTDFQLDEHQLSARWEYFQLYGHRLTVYTIQFYN